MKEHVIINRDRTVVVPESLKKIGIQFDHNVNTITFDCPRYPDEDSSIDMSKMPIFINYMLPDKTPGSSLALNVVIDETDDTLMHFDWKITNAITPVNGVLSTLICVKQSDADGNELYHWNTDLFQKFTVGNGMECNGQVAEMNPDVITQLLARMGEVDTRTSAEAMSGYVNEYMTENPPQPTDEQVGSGVNTYMASNGQTHVNTYMASNGQTHVNTYMASNGQTHVNTYMTENQELVQNSVDDYLGRNPLQLDESLTDSTKAAPADKVGELKGDLVDNIDYFGMLEGDYIEQDLAFVDDKYLYRNGQVNSGTDRKYAMVKVPKSRKVKFSSFNQDTAYALMYYNSSIPSVSSYVGTYEKITANKIYKDEEVTIPDNVKYIGFNVCKYSTETYSFYSFEPTKSVDNLKDANFASKDDLTVDTTIVSSADSKSTTNNRIGFRATKDFKLVSFKSLSIDSSETIKFYILRKQEDGTYHYAYSTRDIIVGNKYEIGFDVKKGDYLALWCYTSSPSSVCYCEDKGNTIFDYFDSYYEWNGNTNEWVNQDFNRSVACEIEISENKFELINAKIDELTPSTNIFDYEGNEISVFTKILCIGDSLTAGGMNSPDVTPNDEYQKRTVGSEYSYPTQLKKQYGVDCTNWGRSGETSVQWYNAKKDEDWSGHDACIIYLGNNDWRIDESSVETSVATNYEYLNKIIDKARADNHGIRIFLCTFLPGWGQQCYGGITNNVKQIVNENADCWLIDLNAYSKCQPNTAYWYTHLTALGYQQMAKEIGSAISYHINHDSDSFKWVRFIGTNYATVFD